MSKMIFKTSEAKLLFKLRMVIQSLDYIGKETKLSDTEDELRLLSIKDVQYVVKRIEKLNKKQL